MDTPESRLNAATPCGIIRDGHEMTLVRLDDLQSLLGALTVYEREGRTARERCAGLLVELERADVRHQEAMRKLGAVREAIA
jgi:hypothetical protein